MEPGAETRQQAGGRLLLQDRSYRLLWAGQTISSFGDRFISIALPFAVLAAGHGVGALGIVLAARSIPSVGFLLVSGVVADRLPRRLVMLASDGVRATMHLTLAVLIASHGASVAAFAVLEALYGALPLLFLSGPSSAWLIGVAIGLSWAAISFGNTLWFTVMQQHVPPDKLSRVSAVDDFGSFVLNPIVFAVIGPIAGAFGFSATLLVCGLALLIVPVVQLLLIPEIRRL